MQGMDNGCYKISYSYNKALNFFKLCRPLATCLLASSRCLWYFSLRLFRVLKMSATSWSRVRKRRQWTACNPSKLLLFCTESVKEMEKDNREALKKAVNHYILLRNYQVCLTRQPRCSLQVFILKHNNRITRRSSSQIPKIDKILDFLEEDKIIFHLSFFFRGGRSVQLIYKC